MDLLWQKESNDAGALYIDLFKDISADFRDAVAVIAKSKNVHRIEKSNELSEAYRNQGNVQFQERKWFEAMNLYNASLCFAESGSENVSLAYANRSACFLRLRQYEKCLADIELAKKARYPEHLMQKLNKRRADCLKLMKSDDRGEEIVAKLSYKADENFPGMANVLKIEYNEEFGRYISAKCDIPAGKTVLVDESAVPPSHGMQQYSCCAVCAKSSMNFIPCGQCTNALFCNSGCANVNSIHKMECQYNLFDPASDIEFFVRSIFLGLSSFEHVDDFITFVDDTVHDKSKMVPDTLKDMKSKYRGFLQLFIFSTPENLPKYLQNAYKMYTILLLLESVEKQFDAIDKKRFLMHLTLHHVCVMASNAYSSKGNKTCVSIVQSYLNHACAANLLSTDDGKYAICTTVRPVRAGQQLFVTYFGELFCTRPVDFCQTYLFQTYGFQCKCERCKPNPSLMKQLNLASDPTFKLVAKEMRIQPSHEFGKKKLIALQKKCVDLLNRVGDKHWCNELGFIMHSYGNIFEILHTKSVDST
ncbi:SET and MYND domain-containing protein 4-like [Sitodiplosis mosellana]|uniref:SET and MYND domain-containing protein 4-like n=1 Tax=Sitodiplosis mosellana TaxID=263140 RepID=UPI0024438E76|nr:SET and MYND domain-containing protein 4-like [Sitodiplosis mosellana]